MERCTDLEQLEKKEECGKAPQSTVCIESFSYTAFNRSLQCSRGVAASPRWSG